ncbi:uncharacterized protein LOC133798513 isoform X2 [Humulus lupulus]|uniref:uncharacterized protein LOC133798513 isoform X2 n=1 Tax=Humulus lupulus TaxID=3486 RepID=UPI002B40D01B|nr:uncharacterized protein LOC133798513 isoform X2 [Humulus lupulus]
MPPLHLTLPFFSLGNGALPFRWSQKQSGGGAWHGWWCNGACQPSTSIERLAEASPPRMSQHRTPDYRDVQREEKGVEKAIKKSAKRNDMGSAKVRAMAESTNHEYGEREATRTWLACPTALVGGLFEKWLCQVYQGYSIGWLLKSLSRVLILSHCLDRELLNFPKNCATKKGLVVVINILRSL